MGNVQRKYNVNRAGRFKLAVQQDWCVYCGASATAKDHFAPVSVVASLMSMGLRVSGKFLVPSCGECNGIAHDSIFVSIGAKRRYIQGRLKRKYSKLLNMPDWTEEELDEMGYMMRSAIIGGIAQRDYMRARIAWRNSRNAEPSKLAAIRLRVVAVGRLRDDGD